MNESYIRLIERYFAEHEDGEFCRHPRSVPYSVIWPRAESGHLVFITKPRFMEKVASSVNDAILDHVAMVGGYGLPNAQDLGLIGGLPQAVAFWFLGDLDSPDLTVFAWLRANLPSRAVHYLGIGDRLLRDLGVPLQAVPSISLDQSELDGLSILRQTLPDLHEIVGDQSAALLADGHKIELEALADWAGSILRRLAT